MRPDDATVHALRADLAREIARHVDRSGETQAVAATRLRIPQPTLSRIVNGRVGGASLELLLRIAVRAGLQVVLQTGMAPCEAGAYVVKERGRGRPTASALGERAREAAAEAAASLDPTQRLEAQLRHSALLTELRASSRRTLAANEHTRSPAAFRRRSSAR